MSELGYWLTPPREPTKVPPKSHPHMPKVISTSNKNITSKLRSLEASKCLGGSRNAKSISKLNIKTGGKSTTGVSKMDPQRPRNSELRTLNPELCYYWLYDSQFCVLNPKVGPCKVKNRYLMSQIGPKSVPNLSQIGRCI